MSDREENRDDLNRDIDECSQCGHREYRVHLTEKADGKLYCADCVGDEAETEALP